MSTTETTAAPVTTGLSDRSRAIITGLIKSGRARRVSEGQGHRLVDARGFVTLLKLAPGGGIYRVHRDGNVVLSGPDIVDVAPLQPGFIDAMARLGAPRQSALEVPAMAPQSSLAAVCG